MEKLTSDKYTHITYATGFKIECIPKEQSANVLNYLITGYPLNGKSLDGVIVNFISGEHKGKKGIFKTELYEIEEIINGQQSIKP